MTRDNEINKAVVEAEQEFDFSPIEGSTIAGAVTNVQTQVVVNLVFDEFELDLPLIGGLELELDAGGRASKQEAQNNGFNMKIDKSGAFINGKEVKIDKKDLANGKKNISIRFDDQDLRTEE